MLKSENKIFYYLTIYYSAFQTAHLISLIYAAIIFISTGELSFPALPPPENWNVQAKIFFIGNALIDFINIFITFIFVYKYFLRIKLILF